MLKHQSTRLALLDRHALFRKSLESFLSNQPGLQVPFTTADPFQLFESLKHTPIDILIFDAGMPHADAVEVIRELRRTYSRMKIIVLSQSTSVQFVNGLVNLGIHAYVCKTDEPESLLQAISDVSRNRIHRNKLFTEALYWDRQVDELTEPGQAPSLLDSRERAIIRLMWEEKSNKEIADLLFLSIRSIEKIRQDIKEKLQVKTTVGLFKYALHHQIIGFAGASALLQTEPGAQPYELPDNGAVAALDAGQKAEGLRKIS